MSGHTPGDVPSGSRMDYLRLTRQNDPAVLYTLDQRGQRLGDIRPHRPHAAVLRIGADAWWLVDDLAHELHQAGASIARRVLTHLLRPRPFSLREAGSERVLARVRRRWRWSTTKNGIDCEFGGGRMFLRCTGVWAGRFTLEDGSGTARGELQRGGFGKWFEARHALPCTLPETALLLYAANRMFGVSEGAGSTGGGDE